jgi:hypothetical protein
MMRRLEIEAWTLSVADNVRAGRPVEDSRVELKAEWPDVYRAARRIAAHANAARGDTILWVVGIDEKKGVVGASATDLAKWYDQVQAQFDGLAPDLIDVIVPVGDVVVVALLFETTGAPFVVKNPLFGSAKGEIEREVPWRDGTRVRSARREDLIRLLVPLQRRPTIEVIGGSATVSAESGAAGTWSANTHVSLQLYLAPITTERIVIPFHKCRATLALDQETTGIPSTAFRLSVPHENPLRMGSLLERRELKKLSVTMDATDSELVVDGPGTVNLLASGRVAVTEPKAWPYLLLQVQIVSSRGDEIGKLAVNYLLRKESGTHYSYALDRASVT